MLGSTITRYKRFPDDQELALRLTTNDSYRFKRRLYLLRMGWTLRDVLAHGVIDYGQVSKQDAKDKPHLKGAS